MKSKHFALLVVLLLLVLVFSTTLAGKADPPPDLGTLDPGGFQDIEQDLTINVVFVGYEKGTGHQDIDESDFLSELPSTYRPVNRFPSDYKGNEFLGLTFNYDFNLVYANEELQDLKYFPNKRSTKRRSTSTDRTASNILCMLDA